MKLTAEEIKATRVLHYMAELNGKHSDGAVSTRAVRCKRKPGQIVPTTRVNYFINGNRVKRSEAARFIMGG